MTTLDDLRADANSLAAHYTRFAVADRLLLSGHSHQAWPDVAEEGLLESFADAARDVDGKWERAFAKADELRAGFRLLLGDPHGEYALGASTHDLVLRFLSAMELPRRPRLVTTDGEFHTLRRQLARLEEEGVEVVRVPLEPVTTLAERVAGEVDGNTAAVLVSAVLFETSRLVPGLAHLADVCRGRSIELVVDAYHALGVVPFALHDLGLTNAWVLGGGYKYLQLGEGNCFLRLPAHAQELRPVITGWYAEFGALADERHPGQVAYAIGGDRFAGATYDPASHYRGVRVQRFFAEQGLTPEFLREVSQHQVGLLASVFDKLGLPEDVVTRDRETPLGMLGGFLSLRCADAAGLQAALAAHGVRTDSRGPHLRFGPAPYLSDTQLETAMGTLGTVVRG
ncbi:kynureninase [Amycolatopsis sp. Hca4]|uniref:kynureninase n=1 Tax=Amycolatopsis sp. Hca4 TaxID=2742131 RepID=UPI001590CFC0|nr:kynureninase [Amycolatopsis sp. Hca4]QKV78984.1 kynureninase [Amycolatopsis sp. Hca4]